MHDALRIRRAAQPPHTTQEKHMSKDDQDITDSVSILSAQAPLSKTLNCISAVLTVVRERHRYTMPAASWQNINEALEHLGEAEFRAAVLERAPRGQQPHEVEGPRFPQPDTVRIAIEVSTVTAQLLAVLSNNNKPEETLEALADHAQQGVYRPGAWEREWIAQVFPVEWWEAKTEPGDPHGREGLESVFVKPLQKTEGGKDA
jgi:hypothetical protein